MIYNKKPPALKQSASGSSLGQHCNDTVDHVGPRCADDQDGCDVQQDRTDPDAQVADAVALDLVEDQLAQLVGRGQEPLEPIAELLLQRGLPLGAPAATLEGAGHEDDESCQEQRNVIVHNCSSLGPKVIRT